MFWRLVTFLPLVWLAGCSISTPFSGNGYDSKTSFKTNSQTVVVAVTKAKLGEDSQLNQAFWDYVELIESSIDEQPGMLLFSKRKQLFGPEAWTMTVWENEDDLNLFIYSGKHAEAMCKASKALIEVKTTRWHINREQNKPTWEDALAKLEQPKV